MKNYDSSDKDWQLLYCPGTICCVYKYTCIVPVAIIKSVHMRHEKGNRFCFHGVHHFVILIRSSNEVFLVIDMNVSAWHLSSSLHYLSHRFASSAAIGKTILQHSSRNYPFVWIRYNAFYYAENEKK